MRTLINAALKWLSAVATLIGLASFAEDLQAWRHLAGYLLDLTVAQIPYAETVGRGFSRLIEVYRFYVYPIYQPLIDWFDGLFGVRLPEFMIDFLFVITLAIVSFFRVLIVRLPGLLGTMFGLIGAQWQESNFRREDWFGPKLYRWFTGKGEPDFGVWRKQIDLEHTSVSSFNSAGRSAVLTFGLFLAVAVVHWIYSIFLYLRG